MIANLKLSKGPLLPICLLGHTLKMENKKINGMLFNNLLLQLF